MAPKDSAIFSRSSTVSIAITSEAPAAFAACTAQSPTGPRPRIAAVSPSASGRESIAWKPVPITSPANRATSSERPSGTLRRVRFACGTSTCSACAPCSEPSVAPWPKTRASSHLWNSPRLQKKHSPQAVP